MPLFHLLYSSLLFIATLIGAPAWVLKMRKRGGMGTGLLQRMGIYGQTPLRAYKGTDYYHAVSVGEAVMALKVIREVQLTRPDYRAVIACTTATGHKIVRTHQPENTLLLYAPLDFRLLIHRLFSQLSPAQLILVDSELWPNLLSYTQRAQIPLKIINGRISERSFARFSRVQPLLKRLLQHTAAVCVDGAEQAQRWQHLGVAPERVHDVGSLKFDFSHQNADVPAEFSDQLGQFAPHQLKILIASTHRPEEEAIATQLRNLNQPHLLLVAPRHAERRTEVSDALTQAGYQVTTRSNFTTSPPTATDRPQAFLLDTTGELAQWTTLADVVIIGKCWLQKKGGQNPFEAIAANKPLIAGPHMGNFQPLFSEVVQAGGAVQLQKVAEIAPTINQLFTSQAYQQTADAGTHFLQQRLGATSRTAAVVTGVDAVTPSSESD